MTRPSDAAVVSAFYAALNAGDTGAVGRIVDDHFSPQARLSLPPSLPYGGEIRGAARLRHFFVAAASSSTAIGPANVAVGALIADKDHVAVELAFDWYPPRSSEPLPSAAVEVWDFSAGRVTGIRSYYWDTAACAARTAEAVAS